VNDVPNPSQLSCRRAEDSVGEISFLCLAQADEDQEGDIHHDQDEPDENGDDGCDPTIPHVDALWLSWQSATGVAAIDVTGLDHGHDLAAACEVDQRGRDEGEDPTQDDLGGGQGVVEAASTYCGGDYDAGNNADAAGQKTTDPRSEGPIDHAFAHHLAGDGAYLVTSKYPC
jgi:hypothetical protein